MKSNKTLNITKLEYKKPSKKEIEFLIDKVKINKASLLLGISTTTLKKTCREYGFAKWKYRESLSKAKKTNTEEEKITVKFECPFEFLKKKTEKKR